MPGVHELEDQAPACGVDGVQHFLLAGPLFRGGKTHLDAGGTGLRGDVAVRGDDGAGAGCGDLAVEFHLLRGAGARPGSLKGSWVAERMTRLGRVRVPI